MNSIIRVFPRRTAYTPNDACTFIGLPPMVLPEHREVHISCVFTWDKADAIELAYQWEGRTDKPVKTGGPAFGSSAEDFTPGLYLRPDIVFTSRGCNNTCPWCGVPTLEGRLRELPVVPGRVIQDNNFLQTNRAHKEKVFTMLRTQRGICFKGGLEAGLIDDHFVDAVRGLRIAELWLACDTDGSLPAFRLACSKLKAAGFNREKIKCYTLIGDDMETNEARLREIYHAGAMPFAMLYQPLELSPTEKADRMIKGTPLKREYDADWKAFHRMWSRPAATTAHMERGTSYKDYHT